MPSIGLLLLSLVGASFASPANIGRRDFTTTAQPTAPTPPGTVANCGAYRLLNPGETCITIEIETGLTVKQFRDLNPSINADCTNLVAGWDYCIAEVSNIIPRAASATPTPSPTPVAGYTPPPGPTKPGTTNCCNLWHTVREGDTCLSITSNAGITFQQFRALNSGVNGACNNLWIGYSYCIEGDTDCNTPPTSPTNPPVSTPTPTQVGMATGCKTFYQAQGGDYCQAIAWKYNIDVATFLSWNPAVGRDCSALLVGYYYCVGK